MENKIFLEGSIKNENSSEVSRGRVQCFMCKYVKFFDDKSNEIFTLPAYIKRCKRCNTTYCDHCYPDSVFITGRCIKCHNMMKKSS